MYSFFLVRRMYYCYIPLKRQKDKYRIIHKEQISMALETTQNNTPKQKALELAIQTIEKQFGKGSIMRLGTGQSLHEGIQAIPTGSLSLDLALGIGGIPKGRVVEIYG